MEIECTFDNLLWKGQNVYTCVVRSASILKPNARIQSFIGGVHENGKTHEDVTGILFSDTQVECFPKGVDVIFPNLTHFSIKSCGLKSVSRVNLIGLRKIEKLYLAYNQLTSLPDNLFTDMPKLEFISFFHNNLEVLSSNILQPILKNNLTWMDFRNNTKIDAMYEAGVAGSCATLEVLMDMIDEKCTKPVRNEQSFCFKEKMIDGLKKLWTSGKFSDFVIIAGFKKFRVHKHVLAIHSSVFAEMFDENDVSSEMNIQNLSAEAVEKLLSFLYTGEISNNDHAFELFALASKLKIHELRLLTEEIIVNDLDNTNAFKVFTLGHRYSSETFKLAAFEEIRKMFPERKLADNLIERPDEVKELIEFKEKFEAMIQKLNELE